MKLRRIIALLLALSMLLATPVFAADDESGADEVISMVDRIVLWNKLDTLLEIIERYSLYEYDGDADVLKAAIASYFTRHPEQFEEFANEIFATQDSYSHYMEPSTYDSSYVLNDSFVGIGIELDQYQDGVIIAVIPNSPAAEAGMKAGDVIFSADGEVLDNTYFRALQDKLRGEEGTPVTVGVLRNGKPLEFTMFRRKIELSNIDFKDMGSGVAYIRIAHFGDMPDTFFDFVNIYTELDDMGFTSVIFDVRDNGGGSLDTLLNILNYTFWERGTPMFSLWFRDESENETYYSLGAGWEPETVVVLTNANSASAAELFAGALGYMAGAWIVGEDKFTHGKGVGQNHLGLIDESMAIITTFEVVVGEDIEYNEVGIPSDIVAPPTLIQVGQELTPLNTAIEIFPGARGRNAKAVEQRLALLGYIGEQDGVFDKSDLDAANRFRADMGLGAGRSVDGETMELLDSAAGKITTTKLFDAALAQAIALCTAE